MVSIAQAFKSIRREDYMLEPYRYQSTADIPFPIGYGQTISQPTTVKMMLSWLDPRPGDRILDVGSGSGWTTALLSELAGPKGEVYAVELIPELVEFGKTNCAKAGITIAKFFQAENELGLKKYAPYDRILVSASASECPNVLLDQLKIGGKMVIPVQNDILEISKLSETNYETLTHPGFVFVPLIVKE